jgi:NAD(P)-dependent dehydrogenase (short-subunit alcohol dehydrogenase family)
LRDNARQSREDVMQAERIVITGSTRGLGINLAREFLARGCRVMISGRKKGDVDAAVRLLSEKYPGTTVRGCACDVADPAQSEALWKAVAAELGGVDHWICNAGIGQPMRPIWELPLAQMDAVVRTDLLGPLYGARAAMPGLRAQGSGAIWFMEGLGSDGRIIGGMSVYGAAKRAVRYAAHALAVEAHGSGILVGTLSPGIMATDFIKAQAEEGTPAERESRKKLYNILADKPETVARFLVPRILAARKNGTHIAWLTGRKAMFRFMTAGLARRKVL